MLDRPLQPDRGHHMRRDVAQDLTMGFDGAPVAGGMERGDAEHDARRVHHRQLRAMFGIPAADVLDISVVGRDRADLVVVMLPHDLMRLARSGYAVIDLGPVGFDRQEIVGITFVGIGDPVEQGFLPAESKQLRARRPGGARKRLERAIPPRLFKGGPRKDRPQFFDSNGPAPRL